MDITPILFEIIDMRSFSNLWYWIGLAVVWSSASHWVLGVPNDMIQRARRYGDQAQTDFEDVTRVNCNRLIYIVDMSGVWLLGIVFFMLTSLAILGFFYGMEFAQAVFLLAFPVSIVGVVNLSTARRIKAEEITGEQLQTVMTRHRIYVQVIGMISIFLTSLWGMAFNLRFLVHLQ